MQSSCEAESDRVDWKEFRKYSSCFRFCSKSDRMDSLRNKRVWMLWMIEIDELYSVAPDS